MGSLSRINEWQTNDSMIIGGGCSLVQTLLPKTGKFTGNTSLDSRGCSAFRQVLPRCDEGPACLGRNRNREKQGTLSEFPTRWHFPQTKFPKQLSFGLI